MATPAPLPPPRRIRGPRALLISLIFFVVMTIFGLYNAGYGVLTSTHEETSADAKMVLKRCSYFTGRETVINHVMRPAGDPRGKPSCDLVSKVTGVRSSLGTNMPMQAPSEKQPAGPIIELAPPASAPSDQPPKP
jgi:hypothetical protein